MCTLASLRSDWWTTCPELVDGFIGIRRIDSFGVWLENPYFKVLPSGDFKAMILQEQTEALKGKALVLVKWQYVATIIYLEGQKVDSIPLGFLTPSEESQCETD